MCAELADLRARTRAVSTTSGRAESAGAAAREET